MTDRISIKEYIQGQVRVADLPLDVLIDFRSNILDMKTGVEKESDRYFFLSLFIGALYILKYFGVSFKLKLFEVEILSAGDPLFLLAAASLCLLSLSAMRAADSTYYERIIDALCGRIWPTAGCLGPLASYGGNSLHHNVMDIPISQIKSWYEKTLLFSSRFGVGLIVTVFAIGPIFIGGSFLYKFGSFHDSSTAAKSITIFIMLIAALVEGLLALRFLADDEPDPSD